MPGPLEGVRVVEVASFVFVPASGGDPRRLGRRGDQGRAPDRGATRCARSPRGACRPGSTASSHLFEVDQPWQAGDRHRRQHRRRAGTILMSLVDTADVFLTNLLPAARTKLGIEPDDVLGAQPAHRLRPGHRAGPARPARRQGRLRRDHLLGSLRGGDRRHAAGPGVPVADARARASATCSRAWRWPAASARRCSSASAPGKGTVVDVSLMSAGLWAMGMTDLRVPACSTSTSCPHQDHTKSPNPLTNQYRTKDGHFVALGFLQADRYWPEFCMVVDHLEWIADERFATIAVARRQRRGVRDDARRAVRRAHAGRVGGRAVAPAGPVGRVPQGRRVRYDEQVQANEYAQLIQHDDDGKVVLVPAPAQFGGEVTQLGPGPGARRRHRRAARRARLRRHGDRRPPRAGVIGDESS